VTNKRTTRIAEIPLRRLCDKVADFPRAL